MNILFEKNENQIHCESYLKFREVLIKYHKGDELKFISVNSDHLNVITRKFELAITGNHLYLEIFNSDFKDEWYSYETGRKNIVVSTGSCASNGFLDMSDADKKDLLYLLMSMSQAKISIKD